MKQFNQLLVFLLMVTTTQIKAQNTIFLSEGKIEFERKLNLYAQMDDDNSWTDLAKKTMPKFKTSYFNLTFSKGKTLYQPGRDNAENNRLWPQPAEENVVYADLDNSKTISQKKVYEQLFLIQDSTRQIKWKITDETRVIAGFNCRRANAIIMDSIYVVAFYTDEILTAGGPESFSGLPGMILGVAMPHQHVTWFATKVATIEVTDNDLKVPAKGKKTDNIALKQTLQDLMKDWDKKYSRRFLEATLL